MNISFSNVNKMIVKRSSVAWTGKVSTLHETIRGARIPGINGPSAGDIHNPDQITNCQPCINTTQFAYFLLMSRLQ